MTLNKAHQEPLWTTPYALTIVTLFFVFIPFSLSLPILPMYIIDELHGSVQLAGLINTVFFVACVLFRTQTARLENILGKSNTLKISFLLFFLSYVLYLTTANIVAIIVIRFFSGMCFAILNTSIMSIGTQLTPASRKSEGIAYLTTINMIGWVVGPFIGLNIVRIWSFNGIFIFCSLILFLGMAISFFINMSKLSPVNDNNAVATGFSLHDFLEIRALPLCSVVFLTGFAYCSVTSFVAVYANSLNLFTAGAYYFVILALSSAVSRLLTGNAYNRLGANALIYPSFILFAIGFFLLSYAQTTFIMLMSAAFVGIGYGTVMLCMQTIIVNQVPKDRTSVVTATYYTSVDFGNGIGAYILGACIPLIGYSNLYLLLSPFILCISILYFVVYCRNTKIAL